tara:strand:+ start:8863 stop:9093 length:231 start_codon:yes stop_codon:yes gene_type:complete
MNDKVKQTLKENFNNYLELLDDDEIEKLLIKELNDNVDIPIINEKTEKKIMKAIYKSILGALKKIDIENILNKENN